MTVSSAADVVDHSGRSERRKAYFISDLHLGAPYFSDSREAEMRVVAFLDSIMQDAAELYLLGDILDYWYESRNVVPRGFVRFFGKLAEMSDSGIKITWLKGNHDIWIFDYLPSELGIEVADGSIVRQVLGKRIEMAHGDGIGGNLRFRCMRSIFRNRFCQWLYAGIHPRWTIEFAQRWSRSSRDNGSDMSGVASDLLCGLRRYCMNALASGSDVDYFIFGHLHLLVDEKLSGDARMIVLGDWISQFTYAVFDGREMKVEKYVLQHIL